MPRPLYFIKPNCNARLSFKSYNVKSDHGVFCQHFFSSLSRLGLYVVCGLLFPDQSVAGEQSWRQSLKRGCRCSKGSHHLFLLLHFHLGQYYYLHCLLFQAIPRQKKHFSQIHDLKLNRLLPLYSIVVFII